MAKKSEEFKRQVVVLLLSGMAIDAIAKELNVSDTTIQNWLKEPEFKKQLNEASESIFNASMVRILSLNDKAINNLEDILENSNDKNKLAAIKLILDSNHRFLDRSFVLRLEQIESKLEALNE